MQSCTFCSSKKLVFLFNRAFHQTSFHIIFVFGRTRFCVLVTYFKRRITFTWAPDKTVNNKSFNIIKNKNYLKKQRIIGKKIHDFLFKLHIKSKLYRINKNMIKLNSYQWTNVLLSMMECSLLNSWFCWFFPNKKASLWFSVWFW